MKLRCFFVVMPFVAIPTVFGSCKGCSSEQKVNESIENLFIGEPVEEAIEKIAERAEHSKNHIRVENIANIEKGIIYAELKSIPFQQDTVPGIKVDFVGMYPNEELLSIFAHVTANTNYELKADLLNNKNNIIFSFETLIEAGFANHSVKNISCILSKEQAAQIYKVKISIR